MVGVCLYGRFDAEGDRGGVLHCRMSAPRVFLAGQVQLYSKATIHLSL